MTVHIFMMVQKLASNNYSILDFICLTLSEKFDVIELMCMYKWWNCVHGHVLFALLIL